MVGVQPLNEFLKKHSMYWKSLKDFCDGIGIQFYSDKKFQELQALTIQYRLQDGCWNCQESKCGLVKCNLYNHTIMPVGICNSHHEVK